FIHGFVFPFQLIWLKLFIPRDTRLFVQHHAEQPFRGRLKHLLQKAAYRGMDAYLFASGELAEPYLDSGIIPYKERVYEMMETSRIFKKEDKALARERIGVAIREPLFLWVGRLHENKDPLTVLKACALLRQEEIPFRLYMVYGTNELEKALKTFISHNDLTEQV